MGRGDGSTTDEVRQAQDKGLGELVWPGHTDSAKLTTSVPSLLGGKQVYTSSFEKTARVFNMSVFPSAYL